MTSIKQIEANRRNALNSTGPVSERGKSRSRCNAIRHGLTAETVIGTLEDAHDYRAFETAIIADYDAQSAVERELVVRLASLFWRLRRATLIETELFHMQASHVRSFRKRKALHAGVTSHSQSGASTTELFCEGNAKENTGEIRNAPSIGCEASDELARCFLRLANLPSHAVDRLSRYEATIWRQAAQTMLTLDLLKRRRPWFRRSRIGHRNDF